MAQMWKTGHPVGLMQCCELLAERKRRERSSDAAWFGGKRTMTFLIDWKEDGA